MCFSYDVYTGNVKKINLGDTSTCKLGIAHNFSFSDDIYIKNLTSYTIQHILDVRAKYTDCSFAEMYGEKMYLFGDLVTAHQKNDFAVMSAYGFNRKITESECVAELMKLYQKLT